LQARRRGTPCASSLSPILLAATACGPFVYKIDVQQGNYVTQDAAAR
jgi:outer membrane protein assembly factor BamE (lipoprotein component of BamABCDE complex)